MRKHASVGSVAINATALLLLLLLGTVAHNRNRVRPAIILFEPASSAPLPARPGHVPLPKRRLFLPPMVAVNDGPALQIC
jgi:hypothetical protein